MSGDQELSGNSCHGRTDMGYLPVLSTTVEIVSGLAPENPGGIRKMISPIYDKAFGNPERRVGLPLPVPPLGALVVSCPDFENVGRLFSTGGRKTTSPPACCRRSWSPSRALPGVLGESSSCGRSRSHGDSQASPHGAESGTSRRVRRDACDLHSANVDNVGISSGAIRTASSTKTAQTSCWMADIIQIARHWSSR